MLVLVCSVLTVQDCRREKGVSVSSAFSVYSLTLLCSKYAGSMLSLLPCVIHAQICLHESSKECEKSSQGSALETGVLVGTGDTKQKEFIV